ncbi:hypothetical protein M426DRAFT_252393 [Hypoxylon sp. CI-4A]|nr:hypothetical protein M426DRAFT_252393 [Hypoxylon sp. CI-4A]
MNPLKSAGKAVMDKVIRPSMTVFWNSVDLFLFFGPLWLILFTAFATYANDFNFCWLTLMAPQETEVGLGHPLSPARWHLGLCLLIISSLIRANWFLPWIQIVVMSRVCDRHWKPPNNPSSKRIMQADQSLFQVALDDGRLAYMEGRRPRRCPFVGSSCNFDLSDRVYHCSWFDRCFPVYDHYCEYLHATVYLRTMKPYCFVLIFVFLDALYSFAVSLFAVCESSSRHQDPFVASMIFCCLILFLLAFGNTPSGLYRLVWSNMLAPELSGKHWTLAMKYRERDRVRLKLVNFDKNPWDLGVYENIRQVFGLRWWSWFFFWWTPERVSRYGKYVDRDLPFSDFVSEAFTREIMDGMQGVVIDHIEAQRQDVPATHVGAFIRQQRSARRRTQTQSHESI